MEKVYLTPMVTGPHPEDSDRQARYCKYLTYIHDQGYRVRILQHYPWCIAYVRGIDQNYDSVHMELLKDPDVVSMEEVTPDMLAKLSEAGISTSWIKGGETSEAVLSQSEHYVRACQCHTGMKIHLSRMKALVRQLQPEAKQDYLDAMDAVFAGLKDGL